MTVALAALVIGWASIGTAAAQSEGGVSRARALDEIRERVRELRDELAALDAMGTSVEAELERLRLDLQLQQQMVAEATAERSLAEDALRSSQATLEALGREFAEIKARLARRILDLYKAAPADWLRGFITVRAPSDFFLYVRTLRFLARRDARLVPFYLEKRSELEVESERLAEREREVVRSVARERNRLAELEAARRRQSLVAEALERERARVEREADTLDDKERKLALLIAVFADRSAPSPSTRPIQDFRGALDWPMIGEISIPFGPRYEARYGTRVPHNGVQITPSEGGLVTPVFPGVVIFAAPFEGFGLTAVVHHPDSVFSLYAGLEELNVSKDDVVALSQVLGRTGSPLYFEIRVENRPEDPMEWLR